MRNTKSELAPVVRELKHLVIAARSFAISAMVLCVLTVVKIVLLIVLMKSYFH